MVARLPVILLTLAGLLLAGCTGARLDTSSRDPATPPTRGSGSGLGPTGLPEGYHQATATGPGGEIRLGATRYEPNQTEANDRRSKATPRVVETALPVTATEPSKGQYPYCRPIEASLDLSVPDTHLAAGESLTVAITLVNGDTTDVRLGQALYSLSVQPEGLVVGNLEPVQQPTTLEPGDSGQAQFVLRGVAPGEVVLAATASYEMHAMDYSWASWSGCQSQALEVTIVP